MGERREFYPYSGISTAAIEAIDVVELAFKRAARPYKADELKKDRELLVNFLLKNQGICVVKVRVKKPENARQTLSDCRNFEAFLIKETVTHGRFNGGRLWVLYLIPSLNKQG